MKYYNVFGMSVPELGWVPAPSYILRRAAILEILKKNNSGKVLEIGCGSGALLYDLYLMGFYGIGVDISKKAREIANLILKNVHSFEVLEDIEKVKEKNFDYLMFFEVLEHIEDDEKFLNNCKNLLNKKGKLLISVPAHMKMWTNTDDWAGHYRRYEKIEITQKLEKVGFEVKIIWSIGFPLSNIIMPLRSYFHGRYLRKTTKSFDSKKNKTMQSGIERKFEIFFYNIYSNPLGRLFFKFFIWLQSLFYLSDKGVGYLILAEMK